SIASSKFAAAVDRFPQPKDRFGDPICRRPPKAPIFPKSTNLHARPKNLRAPQASSAPRARQGLGPHPGASSAQALAVWAASLPGFAGSAWAAPPDNGHDPWRGRNKNERWRATPRTTGAGSVLDRAPAGLARAAFIALRRQRSPSAALL